MAIPTRFLLLVRVVVSVFPRNQYQSNTDLANTLSLSVFLTLSVISALVLARLVYVKSNILPGDYDSPAEMCVGVLRCTASCFFVYLAAFRPSHTAPTRLLELASPGEICVAFPMCALFGNLFSSTIEVLWIYVEVQSFLLMCDGGTHCTGITFSTTLIAPTWLVKNALGWFVGRGLFLFQKFTGVFIFSCFFASERGTRLASFS